MPKKNNLVASMRKSAQPISAAKLEPPQEGTKQPRPDRDNKSPITGFFGLDVKKQLRILAAEQSKTIQRLLAEALNDLFDKYKKPAIVPLSD